MVKILLTDSKQPQKFLSLPFNEQLKQGLLLDINNNEGVECLLDPENEQANELCESFLTRTYDVKRKDVIDHFGEYCKKGKEVFRQNLDQLEENAGLDDLCDGKHELTPQDADFFMHVDIKSSNTIDQWKKLGYKEKDITYEVNLDIPLSVNSNPKKENPHDWLQIAREISNLESDLGLEKESPFWKNDRRYNRALGKYYEKVKYDPNLKIKKPVLKLIPKELLGKSIESVYPDNDNDVVYIGFLNEDEEKSFFVKQKE